MPVTWRPQKKAKTPNKNAVLGRSFKPTGLDRLQKYSKSPLENAYLELFFVILLILRCHVGLTFYFYSDVLCFVTLFSLRLIGLGWVGS